jgi:hypothetical protein
MADYINIRKKWSYIKYHGSVNWIRRINNEHLETKVSSWNGTLDFVTQINPLDANLANVRPEINTAFYKHADNQQIRYPVMVLPNIEEKKHICPEEHISAIQPFIQNCNDFWFLGTSLIDKDINELLCGVKKKEN